MLGFLVPSEMMFDYAYWKWRIEKNPTEYEIYHRHLEYYLKCFGIEAKVICGSREAERFTYLLRKRNCPENLIADLLDENISENLNYDVLYSELSLGKNTMVMECFRRINSYMDGKVHSKFLVDCEETMGFLRFYPFADIGGKARINGIWIDAYCILEENQFVYYPKIDGYVECGNLDLPPGKHMVHVEWEYAFL